MSVPSWASLGGEGARVREQYDNIAQDSGSLSALRSQQVRASTSASDITPDALAAYFDKQMGTLDVGGRAVMNTLCSGDPNVQPDLVSYVNDKAGSNQRKPAAVEDDVFSAVGGLELGIDAEVELSASERAASAGTTSASGMDQQLSQQPSRTLFARNISSEVSDEDIHNLFSAYGTIRSLYTACKHRGFVTVTYYDLRHAVNAMSALQSFSLGTNKLELVYVIKAGPSEAGVNQGTIVVFNLDPDTTNERLVWLFSKFGDVKEIRESPTRRNQKFIEFYDVRHAASALRAMNRAEQLGKLPVQCAQPTSALLSGKPDVPSQSLRSSAAMLQGHTSHSWDPSFATSMDNLYSLVNQAAASAQLQAGGYSDISLQLPAGTRSGVPPLKFSTGARGNLHVSDSASSMVNSQLVNSHAASALFGTGSSPALLNSSSLPGYPNRGPMNGPYGSPTLNRPEFLYPHTPAMAEALVGGSGGSDFENIESLAARDPMTFMAAVESAVESQQQFWNAQLGVSNSPTSPGAIWSSGLYGPSGACGLPNLAGNIQDWQARQQQQLALAGLSLQHPMVDLTPANILLAASLQQHLGQFPGRGSGTALLHNVAPSPAGLGAKSASAGSLGSQGSTDRPREQARSGGRLSRRNADPAAEAERKAQQEKLYALNSERILNGEDKRTTLMIKNIPNKYTQKMLLSTVDEHFRGTYDFFYLPIDFKNKCNVGYAFINMIRPEHILPLFERFHNKKWERFNSEKVCHISYARIQGRNSLVAHFQNSSLMHEDKRCRPILFTSDGDEAGEQEPFPVGPNVRARVGYSYRDKGKEREK